MISFSHLEKLREKLYKIGFKQEIDNKVLCRFIYEGILVDIMSVNQVGWAPGNKWFEAGFKKSIDFLIDDVEIKLFPLPYYIATKFAAFQDRGINDPYLSHDLEDIVYVLDNIPDLEVKLLESDDKEVREFLKTNFRKMIETPSIKEAVEGHLPFHFQKERLERIEQRILKYLKI